MFRKYILGLLVEAMASMECTRYRLVIDECQNLAKELTELQKQSSKDLARVKHFRQCVSRMVEVENRSDYPNRKALLKKIKTMEERARKNHQRVSGRSSAAKQKTSTQLEPSDHHKEVKL